MDLIKITCSARAYAWSFHTLTSDRQPWRPRRVQSEGMTAALKTAVYTGSHAQLTKVSLYIRDI